MTVQSKGSPVKTRMRASMQAPGAISSAAATRSTGRDARRVILENVRPIVDGGRFLIKRCVGEQVVVEADIFTDGHDTLAAKVSHRFLGDSAWSDTPMQARPNDRWWAAFTVERAGSYEFKICAWLTPFETWRHELSAKFEAGQNVTSELLEGTRMVRDAAARAAGVEQKWLETKAQEIASAASGDERVQIALDPALSAAMAKQVDFSMATETERFAVRVDRQKARFGTWYEMFPRSAGQDPSRSATFRDVEARLPDIAEMGFDVLYLAPIHPIGTTHRKGRNNRLDPAPEDPGSPWAIGSAAGGHKDIEPGLGTLKDFDRLVKRAATHGIEIALDLAYQCSPDHPYAKDHPEWFKHRPDGTIKYAENPPKKYQDIYPINFESQAWEPLWEELKSIVEFWIGHGVKIFRVDNPHTKPFRFWGWLIGEVQREHPDTIFLSEAFTRPKVMHQLAKRGFTQSYTYFTWRNTKQELTEYFTELTKSDVREYMRPNLFVNTPDILHEYLQFGGRAAFQVRLILAATLGASYGIYGPPFELCESLATPGTEDYVNSEKYEIRVWNHDRPGHIREMIARVNRARRENPALQSDWRLEFHEVDNDQLIFYSKRSLDGSNIVFMVVNLDPHHPQQGWVQVPLEEFGIPADQPFQVHDVLGDARYLWNGDRNFVMLNPHVCPAHMFIVRRKIKTERDFDYYL